MYVCICHGITDSQIRDALEAGKCPREETGAGSSCGSCEEELERMEEMESNEKS